MWCLWFFIILPSNYFLTLACNNDVRQISKYPFFEVDLTMIYEKFCSEMVTISFALRFSVFAKITCLLLQ